MIQKPHLGKRVLAMGWGCVAISFAVSAQTVAPGAEQDWRKANDAVGQLKRGHADVLKWEKANVLPSPMPKPLAQGLQLLTMEDAIRQAWRSHRDLARPLARLGTPNVELIAQGRWTELDPVLQRKVDDMDELLAVAAQSRKAWLQAVAAGQVLKQHRHTLDAAEAGNELARRMVSVGNWSRLQQAQVQLAQSSAHMNLQRAQLAVMQAQATLIKTLGLTGVHTAVGLPDRLPDLPDPSLSAQVLDARATAVATQLPRAESLRNGANVRLARQAYLSSHALALSSRDEVLKVREFITEETVLRYNGMLKSVWDLLGEVSSQSQAGATAIEAQRDFWIAETDLQWVLQGGEPSSFVSLGGGNATAAPAGH